MSNQSARGRRESSNVKIGHLNFGFDLNFGI